MKDNVLQFRQNNQIERMFQVRYMTSEGLRFIVLFAPTYKEMVDKLPKSCNRIISARVN